MTDTSLLQAALHGYEIQIAQLRANMAAVQKQLRGSGIASVPIDPPARKRHKMSAAARKRIGEAQKKRWAEWKKKQG